jgi:hypothetical protein
MAWRNQGITGSNNIPLGNRRRFGGDDGPDDGGYNPAAPAEGLSELKRGRSPQRGKSSPTAVLMIAYSFSHYRSRRPATAQEAQPLGRCQREQGCWLDGLAHGHLQRYDYRAA